MPADMIDPPACRPPQEQADYLIRQYGPEALDIAAGMLAEVSENADIKYWNDVYHCIKARACLH